MKYALLIGNNQYKDGKLARLKSPRADIDALREVLLDRRIGEFDEVVPIANKPDTLVRRAICAFVKDKKPDDLLLFYFSGHGVLDDNGRLYLAVKDTAPDALHATAISAAFITEELDGCRSKRQLLILDCCNSGAFSRGKGPAEAGRKVVTKATFEGGGFGRVVLTASDSLQQALEGDQVMPGTELSLFSHFLIDGLKTGEADYNHDGKITPEELYDYLFGKLKEKTTQQTPQKWTYRQAGEMVIAKNPFLALSPAGLPDELRHAIVSPLFGVRSGAMDDLQKFLDNPAYRVSAAAELKKLTNDDSRTVSEKAARILKEYEASAGPQVEMEIPHTRRHTPLIFKKFNAPFWVLWTLINVASILLFFVSFYLESAVFQVNSNQPVLSMADPKSRILLFSIATVFAGTVIGILQYLRLKKYVAVQKIWVFWNIVFSLNIGVGSGLFLEQDSIPSLIVFFAFLSFWVISMFFSGPLYYGIQKRRN